MALFERVKIVDERGTEHVINKNFYHKPLEVKDAGQTICVTKQDVLDISKDTTCVNRSNNVYRGN